MEPIDDRTEPRTAGRLTGVGGLSAIGLAGAVLLGACSSGTSTAPTTTAVTHPGTVSTGAGSATSVTAAPETLTPGDIPDTIAYIPYTNSPGGYTFNHPEGWAQTGQGTSVTFTDKDNGVSAGVQPATAAPNATSAQASDIPALRASEPAFALISVADVALPAGPGVLIVYRRNSPPDPVTGRSVRQEVNRYEIFGTNRVVMFDLFGAVGADNVDPYRRMSQSLHLS
jgi:hypothetical protein